MVCKRCGNDNDDNIRFCVHCGADMTAPSAETTQQGSYTQPNYNQPNYNQPNYNQPNYNQPNYNQPNYNQQAGYTQPNYNQPSYDQRSQAGYNPYGYAPSGIARRELVTCILLTIITCGIYGLYWMVCMVDDLNKASNEPQPTTGGTVVLLSIITCGIYSFIWMYRAGEQLCRARQIRYGYPGENNSVLYLVLSLLGLGIVSYCLIQTELNKFATQ